MRIILLITLLYAFSSVAYTEQRKDSFLQCPQILSIKSSAQNYAPSLTNLCISIPSLDWNACANHLLTILTNGNSKIRLFPSMVAVAKDPNPNAYLVNLNSILITSGLTTLINSGEQLAFVLAHEIAHGMIERCAINGKADTSQGDCQRFINTGAPRTEATLILYTDTSHELKADRIAVSIMKDLPFEGHQAAQLLSRISELQIKQGQRISKQTQSRINALQAVDFQQNLLYF